MWSSDRRVRSQTSAGAIPRRLQYSFGPDVDNSCVSARERGLCFNHCIERLLDIGRQVICVDVLPLQFFPSHCLASYVAELTKPKASAFRLIQATRLRSEPQCLHLVAAGLWGSGKHAGQGLWGGGGPNNNFTPCA